MLYKSLVVGAFLLLLSGLSVLDSIDRINKDQVISNLYDDGIYAPETFEKPAVTPTKGDVS